MATSECCGKGVALVSRFSTSSSSQPCLEAECPSCQGGREGSPQVRLRMLPLPALAKLPALSNLLVYVAGHFVEWPAFLLL